MPKFNQEAGLLQKQDLRRREPEMPQEPVAPVAEPSKPQEPKPPTMLYRASEYCSDNKMVVFLVFLAIVGCVVLVGCDWNKQPSSARVASQ